jgi:DNA-binding NarL/FixJ family response regulator
MVEKFNELGPREQKIINLLLQGYENSEIARDLKIAERTVKAHFSRMFRRFGIRGGIKRVKLATLLYREQLWLEEDDAIHPTGTEPAGATSSGTNNAK